MCLCDYEILGKGIEVDELIDIIVDCLFVLTRVTVLMGVGVLIYRFIDNRGVGVCGGWYTMSGKLAS